MLRSRLSRRRLIAFGAGCAATVTVTTGCTWLDARSNDRVTVTVADQYVLDPATLEIPVGTTVVWQNQSASRIAVSTDSSQVDDPALVVVPEGQASWESGDLTAGMTWERTFDHPGTWVYVLKPVDGQVMGVIAVHEQGDQQHATGREETGHRRG